jgi:hypothetical protein
LQTLNPNAQQRPHETEHKIFFEFKFVYITNKRSYSLYPYEKAIRRTRIYEYLHNGLSIEKLYHVNDLCEGEDEVDLQREAVCGDRAGCRVVAMGQQQPVQLHLCTPAWRISYASVTAAACAGPSLFSSLDK